MKISRIDIRNFRKLRQPVTIAGLDDAITVILGDNEEGKSTVLRAVQSAFFDRHSLSGEKQEEMQPYGSGGTAPKVEIAFSHADQACKLAKSFKPQASATLEVGGRTLENDAVEERLRDMLRFTPPGKGAAKADNRGMWSLFWVEQGTAFDPLALNEDARKTLEGTLQSQVGKVLGGERGGNLIEAVGERYDEHFTAKGGERGPAKALRTKLDDIGVRLSTARAGLTSFEDKSDQLRRIESRMAERASAGREAAFAEAVRVARAKIALIDTLRRRHEKAMDDLRVARIAADHAKSQWASRGKLIANIESRRSEIALAEAATEEAQDTFAAAERRKNDAQARATRAEADLTAADQAVTLARAAVERGRLARGLAALKEQFVRAETAAAAIARADAEAAALGLDDETWGEIEKLAKRVEKARIQIESAAAAIVFRPDKGQAVRREGANVPAGTSITLTTPAVFALDGFGEVEVRPSANEEVAALGRAHEKSVRSLTKALADAGVPDLEAAEERRARWTALTRAAAAERAKLDGIAPQGIEALRADKLRNETQLADLGDEAADPVALDHALADAETRAGQQHNEAKGLRGELKIAEAALGSALDKRTRAETHLGGLRAEAKRAAQEIEAARALVDDAALERQLSAAMRDDQAAATHLVSEHAALDRANPDAAGLESKNAESALAQIRGDIRKDQDAALGLRTELVTLGAQGLGEDVQSLDGEFLRAKAALEVAEREANAARLLLETLNAKQHEARENFTGPVRARIKPYLQLLFPDTEIGVDDKSFSITHLHRAGEPEKFEALSLGTREQIAVLVRLAFAEYIADNGEPPVVILDDALVNADPGRMERMRLALRKASQKVQIIVLTCNEADYAQLGAPVIRLAEAQAGAA